MRVLQINKYITINGGSEVVMNNIHNILSTFNNFVINTGFHKINQPYIPNSFSLGEENISIPTFFKNNVLINKIIEKIIKNEIDTVICHNVYHHFPIFELFRQIKYRTNAKLILYLHDYKVVCPTYQLLNKNKICEACLNKNFYQCTLNKCKDNSFFKSTILSLESYYNNKFHDAYKYVDIIISPSYFLKEKVSTMGFQHKIEVLHNPLQENEQIINNNHSNKEHSLLFVGRLSEEKGIDLLLKLAKELDTIPIHIIGDGPLKPVLLKKLSVLKNIKYHGYQDKEKIFNMMRKTKYLLIPSIWYENNPMVILEAMSQGLPVIGSKRGGIPELIGEDRGFCFEPEKIEETVSQIKKMMEISKEDYNKMSQAAIEFSKECNPTNYYKKLLNIINRENGEKNE